MVRNEPRLKYAPEIAYYTFSSLLKTNPHKGYEYGKEMLLASSDEDPDYYAIILPIEWYSDKLKLSAEIYELGIEAYGAYFDHHPDAVVRPNIYHTIAEWYWRIGDKSKAIESGQKAVEGLKSEKNFPASEMAEYESRLRQYKNR
jgi:hypothetical protein